MRTAPEYRLLTPPDEEADLRVDRLKELGIREEPDPEFDAFARMLAQQCDAPIAGINLIGAARQYFAGLYPSSIDRGVDPHSDELRTMECHEGWCTWLITHLRMVPLALDDVTEYHVFAGNPVIDKLGIRAYLGAPLLDPTGALSALGTIFVLDTKPHPWGMQGVEFIKAKAAELVESIHRRASLQNDVS